MFEHLQRGLRQLLRSPAHAGICTVILAIGIGGATAGFSLADAVLFRPLPFPQQDRLITLSMAHRERPGVREGFTEPAFRDLSRLTTTTIAPAAYRYQGLTLIEGGNAEEVLGVQVTASFFRVLGVAPALGSVFGNAELVEGNTKVAVLSHVMWRDRFGEDPTLVGRTISLEEESYVVLGVMPENVAFPREDVRVWVPLPLDLATPRSRARNLLVISRLAEGATAEQLSADLRSASGNLRRERPDQYQDWSFVAQPVLESMVSEARPLLLSLLLAVCLVLLIACLNVANLLLARTITRRPELLLRAALGARMSGILRQALLEPALVVIAGTAGGLLLAVWTLRSLRRLSSLEVARLGLVTIDSRALAFWFLATLLTFLLLALLPMVQVRWMLGTSGGNASGGRTTRARLSSAAQKLMIVVQSAVALTLLVGAALMLSTLWQLRRVDPGWNPQNLLATQLYLPSARYADSARVVEFYRSLLAGVREIPGLEAAAITTALPGTAVGIDFSLTVSVLGDRAAGGDAALRSVSPGYFHVMGIPLVNGRDFGVSDDANSPLVAVVNEAFVRQLLPPDEERLGRRIVVPFRGGGEREIVGVVADTHHYGLENPVRPEFYLPFDQAPFSGMGLVMRTGSRPLNLLPAVRSRLKIIDQLQPIQFADSMENVLAKSLSTRRFLMILLSGFAVVSLGLTALGIYGLVGFIVHGQSREFGIRMSLGAQRGDVLFELARQVGLLVGSGLVVGLLITGALSRLLESFLFGVSPTNPLVLSACCALLLAVALLAALSPARRATRVDPAIALRTS